MGTGYYPCTVSQEILYLCGHWSPTFDLGSAGDASSWPEKILCPYCRTYVRWKLITQGTDGVKSEAVDALAILGDIERRIDQVAPVE